MSLNIATSNDNLRILVAAADPQATGDDLLAQEVAAIKSVIKNGHDTSVKLELISTLSRDKFFSFVNHFNPLIIHFTGYGSTTQKVLMEDSNGWVRNITGRTFADELERSDVHVKCVFFNNCSLFSYRQDVSRVSDYVFRVRYKCSGVDISIPIAKAFYSQLGFDLNFTKAYENLHESIISERLDRYIYIDAFGELPKSIIRKKIHRNVIPEVIYDEDTEHLKKMKLLIDDVTFQEDLNIFEQSIDRKSKESFFDKGCDKGRLEKIAQPKFDDFKGEKDGGPRIYRVYFGTNRLPIDEKDFSKGFSIDRAKQVYYGYCDVTIPKYHTIGSVGDPLWKRLPKFWHDNRLKIRERVVQPLDEYWSGLKKIFTELVEDERTLLIFVHGYNVKFDQAAIRAAQFGFDLDVKGVTAFFSWPSRGTVKGYPADEASIEASENDLGNFIIDMSIKSGAERVCIIAHSMGNRGLLRVFSRMLEKIEIKIPKPFQQIFLAAPDVDVDLFTDLAKVYGQISERTTMYVSGKDKALFSSGLIHNFPRAGYYPPITIVKGIDTIEVTKIDLTFLGHGYIAEARAILNDMYNLMKFNADPNDRFGLAKYFVNGSPYWKFKG